VSSPEIMRPAVKGRSNRFFRTFGDELALECPAMVARPAGRRHVSDRTFLLPPESDLRITDLSMTEDLLVVAATSLTISACCPLCGTISERIHSRYRRTVADLPFSDRALVVRLVARRFKCENAGCPRAVFCERLPKFVDAHARSTTRLKSLHRALGATAGGEAGSRLAVALAIPVSGDTIMHPRRMARRSARCRGCHRPSNSRSR
jgi:zinc-finger of transposase IS204/IS1001/IS1096/IS1165